MRILIVALLISSVALSGCVAPTSGLAMQSQAESEAEKMRADAQLIGIVGVEYTNDSVKEWLDDDSTDAKALLEAGVDQNPGDGFAQAWAYFFRSEDADIIIVLGADGSVLEAEELESGERGSGGFEFAEPLETPGIDSDEAAKIVNENHARFSDIVVKEDAVVMMILATHKEYLEGTYWVFMAITEEGEDLAFAFVDANTGAYQDFSQFFGG